MCPWWTILQPQPFVGGCMRRVIMLGFCCACTRCVWAMINNNGAYLYVDEKDIHNESEPDPLITIMCEIGAIVLREREVNLPNSEERALRYTNSEWGVAAEGLSGPCAQCEAGFSQRKGSESWAELSQEEKNRRRLASVSTKRKKGSNGREQVRTSTKDDHQIVKLDDYRKKGDGTPDRSVPRDDKRRHGQAGKATHIKKAARRARAYGG